MKIIDGKGLWGARLLEFESLPSTNQWAMDNIDVCRHGDVIFAARQTAGKGRFGREWISPGNRCLTCSVIISPYPANDTLTTMVGQLAALALRATLESYSITAQVKWPNDVMTVNHKIAGILAEHDNGSSKVVVGIGLNVNMTAKDFRDTTLLQPATSMKMETHCDYPVTKVLDTLIGKIEDTVNLVLSPSACFPVELWRRHDFLEGRSIKVNTGQTVISGEYAGVDFKGRIRLRDSSGRELSFWSGDIYLEK
jgi:BirA family biotin operon repressor/biotin-[acetyl-CoA-carboxylase] ligase